MAPPLKYRFYRDSVNASTRHRMVDFAIANFSFAHDESQVKRRLLDID